MRHDETLTPALALRADPSPAPADRAGSHKLSGAIRLVALLGLAVAAYLTYVHYAGIKPICSAAGGCEKVQSSAYSKLAGVPVAVLGLASYVVVLATSFIRAELAQIAGWATALVGCGFSVYLTYREVFTIHAICPWCVSSAVLMAVLAGLTTARELRA